MFRGVPGAMAALSRRRHALRELPSGSVVTARSVEPGAKMPTRVVRRVALQAVARLDVDPVAAPDEQVVIQVAPKSGSTLPLEVNPMSFPVNALRLNVRRC